MATMKVKASEARKMFAAMKFKSAADWNSEKLEAKLGDLDSVPTEVISNITDKGLKNLALAVRKAIKDGKDIELDNDEKTKPTAAKASAKTATKAVEPEEDDEEEDEDDDEEDEEGEEDAATEDEEESEEDEEEEGDDDEEEEEAPPKKKGKKGKGEKKPKAAKKEKAPVDQYGFRVGSRGNRLAAALTGTPQTAAEISKKAGMATTLYRLLKKMVANKQAAVTDGKYYIPGQATSKKPKAKAGK